MKKADIGNSIIIMYIFPSEAYFLSISLIYTYTEIYLVTIIRSLN